jgi:glycerol-3-phosphate cytidylyltransferase-like family protein
MKNTTKAEDSKKTYNNEDLKTTVPEHERKDASEGAKPIDEVMNGSMAPTLDEMKQLGKDMEGMKTGTDLKEEGLVTDPIQDEDQSKH